jgi:hypothetical protein
VAQGAIFWILVANRPGRFGGRSRGAGNRTVVPVVAALSRRLNVHFRGHVKAVWRLPHWTPALRSSMMSQVCLEIRPWPGGGPFGAGLFLMHNAVLYRPVIRPPLLLSICRTPMSLCLQRCRDWI